MKKSFLTLAFSISSMLVRADTCKLDQLIIQNKSGKEVSFFYANSSIDSSENPFKRISSDTAIPHGKTSCFYPSCYKKEHSKVSVDGFRVFIEDSSVQGGLIMSPIQKFNPNYGTYIINPLKGNQIDISDYTVVSGVNCT